MKKSKLLIIFLILIPFYCFGQANKLNPLDILKDASLNKSAKAEKLRDLISRNYFERKTDSAFIFTQKLITYTTDNNLLKEKAYALLLMGNINHIYNDNNSATKCYTESLKIFEQLNDKKGKAKVINSLGNSYRKIFNLDEAMKYYEQSLQLSKEVNDSSQIAACFINIGNIYAWRFKSDKALDYYNKSLMVSQAMNNKNIEAEALINIAAAQNNKKEFGTSKKYSFKAMRIGDSLKNHKILAQAYGTLGQSFLLQRQFDDLIQAAEKELFHAKKIGLKEKIDGAYYFLFEAYKAKKDFDNTIKYYDLRKQQRTTVEDIASLITLEKFKMDNQRVKDSLINVAKELKTEIQYQNDKTNLTLAWGGSLAILSILAVIIYRNTKRKQHKAEQERQEQIEEKEKILKDLELSTIDAMIQGQEKERQRLAADLHDSVGATLSAAKLQFEYLIKNPKNAETSEEFIKKTSSLLEDAYVEIRSLAHLKNSGVMAKNGLLPAVEKLSKNASGLNGLSFEVQSFGLEQRLDNSLEITIFRIIQELVTNIIKHAYATKGVIHLTNHEDSLNIMIEDNGIGFNPSQITKTNKGMGISSIDRRIEHLDGKLNIESEKNKGTTVIIDIPL